MNTQEHIQGEVAPGAGDYLTQGIAAVKAGKVEEARKLLDTAIRAAPNDERTWGWFYNVCVNDQERKRCLTEVVRINPNNEIAKKKLGELAAQELGLNFQPAIVQPPASVIPKKKKWYLTTEIKIITFLFCTPLWTLIVIEDPDSSTAVKIVAIVLFLVYVLFACQLVTGQRILF